MIKDKNNFESWDFMLSWIDDEREKLHMSVALEMLRIERLYGRGYFPVLDEENEGRLDVLVFPALCRVIRDYGPFEITVRFIRDFLSKIIRFVNSDSYSFMLDCTPHNGTDLEAELLVDFLIREYGE